MVAQKFTHLSSRYLVKALGTLTMNGSIGTHYVCTEKFSKLMAVLSGMTLTGTLTVTITGNTTAAGDGTHTVIKTCTFAGLGTTDCSVECDSEEVSYAEDQAGAAFLSVCVRLTGTNTNTVKAAVVVEPLWQRGDLTPTGTGTTA
jgi:hypothetical protein